MGLFSKKDTVVKEIAKKEKQKKKQSRAESPEVQDLKGKKLGAWIVQPLVALLLVFVAMFLAHEAVFVSPLDEQRKSQETDASLAFVRGNLETFVKTREAILDSIASSEFARSAVEDESFELALSQLAQSALPDLQKLYVLSQKELPAVRVTYPEMSFATVDTLRDVMQTGKKQKLEAFASNQEWRLQRVVPVFSEDAGQVIGALVAVLDTTALRETLKPTQHLAPGKMDLLPSDEENVRAIVTKGVGDDDVSSQVSVGGTTWQLRFTMDTQIFEQVDRTLVWGVFGGGALLSLLLVYIFGRLHNQSMSKELLQLNAILRAIISGEGKKNQELNYAEFNAVLSNARQYAKAQKATAPQNLPEQASASAPQKIQSADAQADDAPLFDDDLLDLDMLEEGDTSLASVDNMEEEEMVQEVKQLDFDVPQSIFRAYDIRGIVDETLSEDVVELIGKAFATEALSRGQSKVCVGYDGRLSSEPYCEALTRGIVSTGADAIIVGRVPTPVLYFATHHLETGTGVMITGSHNPGNYNGFKMMIGGSTLAGDDIQKLYNRIILQDFESGQGERSEQEVARDYLDTILNDIAVAAPLKVVVDAGNGVAGELGPMLIEELGCEVIPLFCEIDGTFPNHHPDPGKPKNLQDLIAAVEEHNADLGLAFDGDGDRVGVVTNLGKIIWPDRLLMLFAKDVVSRNPGADIIFDVKCSRRLNGLISGYGGRPIMWKTGHSLIKAKMKETGALLAGEMSGHIFFKERWLGFDDGLYSAARLLEILGIEDATSEEVFATFPEDVSTPEINIEVTDENKFEYVEKLCHLKGNFSDGNVSTIDGLRVDFPNGWGLCRASNTTPMLVLRFEADDESALEQIKDKFKEQLKAVDASLDLDF